MANTNGCNESIIEGENGSIIPVKNTDALYGAMPKMIKDNAFRTSLQQNAIEMTVSCLGQSVVWNAILEEYKKMETANSAIQNKMRNIVS